MWLIFPEDVQQSWLKIDHYLRLYFPLTDLPQQHSFGTVRHTTTNREILAHTGRTGSAPTPDGPSQASPLVLHRPPQELERALRTWRQP